MGVELNRGRVSSVAKRDYRYLVVSFRRKVRKGTSILGRLAAKAMSTAEAAMVAADKALYWRRWRRFWERLQKDAQVDISETRWMAAAERNPGS